MAKEKGLSTFIPLVVGLGCWAFVDGVYINPPETLVQIDSNIVFFFSVYGSAPADDITEESVDSIPKITCGCGGTFRRYLKGIIR